MALASSCSLQQLQEEVENSGFFFLPDTDIGLRAEQFKQKGFPLATEAGLEFCKINILDNTRLSELLEATFPWCGLGTFLVIGSNPEHINCILAPRKGKPEALIAQIWSRGSRAIFYKGSHQLSIEPSAGSLLEISPKDVAVDSVEKITLDMKEGGLAVLDARLGFTIIHGFSIFFTFAEPDRLKKFGIMQLPNSSALKEKVNDMIRPKIGLNFKFES